MMSRLMSLSEAFSAQVDAVDAAALQQLLPLSRGAQGFAMGDDPTGRSLGSSKLRRLKHVETPASCHMLSIVISFSIGQFGLID